MTDPYVCHIWFAIYHQYTPVMLAYIHIYIYHTYGSYGWFKGVQRSIKEWWAILIWCEKVVTTGRLLEPKAGLLQSGFLQWPKQGCRLVSWRTIYQYSPQCWPSTQRPEATFVEEVPPAEEDRQAAVPLLLPPRQGCHGWSGWHQVWWFPSMGDPPKMAGLWGKIPLKWMIWG